MLRKARLIRGALVVLALLAVAGFGAFSTFVFNPFESGLGVQVAGLVHRDVDFFFSRRSLSRAFDRFPRLAVQDELEKHPTWRLWSTSPERESLHQELGVDETLAQLEELAAGLPLGLQPLQLFGGQDLALAGNFAGPRLDQADWAVYGSLNWAGKLLFEGLRYPGLIGLEQQGIAAEVEPDFVRLRGHALPRDLYFGRIRDVGVIATSGAFVSSAKERQRKQFEDSMLLRAEYGDHVMVDGRSPQRDEIEVWIKLRALFENLQVSGAWPDTKSESPLVALAGRYFQGNLLNHVVGYLGIRGGVTFDLRGQLSAELMTPLQKRAYYRSTADHAEIRSEVARLAPSDSALLLYLRVNVGDFLRQLLDSIDKETRDLMSDAFRQTGKYRDIDQVVELLESCLRPRIAFIVRPNDYPPDPEGPPNDGATVPSVALVTWVRDGRKADLERFRDDIGHSGAIFGLKGKGEGDLGYYRNFEGGYETREFWNELIPGTGVIATVNAADMCIVTNSHRMLSHVVLTSTQGAPTFPRLSERGDFEGLLASSISQSTVLAWANPRSLAVTLRQGARRWIEDSIFIDWRAERARAEREVVQSSFPEELASLQRNQLPPDVRQQVDAQVEILLSTRRLEILEREVPPRLAAFERKIEYASAVSSALLMLALDSRHVDLSLRVVTPLTRRGDAP